MCKHSYSILRIYFILDIVKSFMSFKKNIKKTKKAWKLQHGAIVTEILWMKLKYVLILNFPNVTAYVSKSEVF